MTIRRHDWPMPVWHHNDHPSNLVVDFHERKKVQSQVEYYINNYIPEPLSSTVKETCSRFCIGCCWLAWTLQWFQQVTAKNVSAAAHLMILGLSQDTRKHVRRARNVWLMYSSMRRNHITARGVISEGVKDLCHKLQVQSLPPNPFRMKWCVTALQLSDSLHSLLDHTMQPTQIKIPNEVHADEVCIVFKSPVLGPQKDQGLDWTELI